MNSETHSWVLKEFLDGQVLIESQGDYPSYVVYRKWLCERCLLCLHDMDNEPPHATMYSCDEWLLRRVYDD